MSHRTIVTGPRGSTRGPHLREGSRSGPDRLLGAGSRRLQRPRHPLGLRRVSCAHARTERDRCEPRARSRELRWLIWPMMWPQHYARCLTARPPWWATPSGTGWLAWSRRGTLMSSRASSCWPAAVLSLPRRRRPRRWPRSSMCPSTPGSPRRRGRCILRSRERSLAVGRRVARGDGSRPGRRECRHARRRLVDGGLDGRPRGPTGSRRRGCSGERDGARRDARYACRRGDDSAPGHALLPEQPAAVASEVLGWLNRRRAGETPAESCDGAARSLSRCESGSPFLSDREGNCDGTAFHGEIGGYHRSGQQESAWATHMPSQQKALS